MRVLSRLAGWMLGAALVSGCTGAGEATGPGSGLPAVGRPAAASQGPRVAVVAALRGDVKVEPGAGPAFAAVSELQLLHDDRLVVGPDSFVLVALHNGHVVRLNAGTDLRVDAMATFHDPPAGTDLEQSFAQLLSPTEREDVALRGAITRVAGWNTRMSAAETIAPQAPPTPQKPEVKLEGAADGRAADAAEAPSGGASPRLPELADAPADALGGAGSVAAPEQRPPVRDVPTEAKKSSKSQAPAGPAKASEDDASESTQPPSAGAKQPAPPTGLDLPKFVVHQRDLDGQRTRVSLPGPFTLVRAELAACAGAGTKIRGRIAGKKLVELQLDGATRKCVPGLIGKAVALEDGWIEMTVTP